jgi:hypothetical protein
MSVIGVHTLLYSSEPDRLRAVLRDVFGWPHVDAGGGWLIFTAPPAEMGVHPAEGPAGDEGHRHLVSFMCDDLSKTVSELRAKGIGFVGEPEDQGFGITIVMKLPGGCDVMLYEPRHPLAIAR